MYKKKKSFTWRSVWQLRYRVYALILILIIGPVMYASGKDINPNIDFPFDQYEVVGSNLIGTQMLRTNKLSTSTENSGISKIVTADGQTITLDSSTDSIESALKKAGLDPNSISSLPYIDLSISMPNSNSGSNNSSQPDAPKSTNLASIVPKPDSPQFTNFLRYPKYNINAPIIQSTWEDLFQKNSDGTLDLNKPIDNSPINSPIQLKLRQGVVHLAFTQQPGELGNSYIVGHSSNFSVVKSNYNSIFKPLESTSKPGEEFIIYDRDGRELKFRVFETLRISESDYNEAYKKFPDRRVVTLQTSILTWVNGQLKPTHRWLTRGELVV